MPNFIASSLNHLFLYIFRRSLLIYILFFIDESSRESSPKKFRPVSLVVEDEKTLPVIKELTDFSLTSVKVKNGKANAIQEFPKFGIFKKIDEDLGRRGDSTFPTKTVKSTAFTIGETNLGVNMNPVLDQGSLPSSGQVTPSTGKLCSNLFLVTRVILLFYYQIITRIQSIQKAVIKNNRYFFLLKSFHLRCQQLGCQCNIDLISSTSPILIFYFCYSINICFYFAFYKLFASALFFHLSLSFIARIFFFFIIKIRKFQHVTINIITYVYVYFYIKNILYIFTHLLVCFYL